MASLSQINIKFFADLKQFSTQMQNASRQMQKLGRNFDKVGSNLSVGVTLPLLGLGAAAVKSAADFETLQTSLITAFNGSESAAESAFESITEFASKTPFQVEEVASAFIKLKNLGLDPSERALTSYGNTASAMGKSLNQVIEAVADAATGEFERLKEFGIKASQQGDRVKFTFKGVETTVAKNAKEIQDYLLNIGEVDFAGGMERQSKTFTGRISTLKDNVALFGKEIGEVLLEYINPIVDRLQDLTKRFRELSPETKRAIVVFGGIAAAIGPALTAMGFMLTNVIPGLITGFKAIRAAVIAFNAVLLANPITAIAVAVGALAGGLLLASSRFGALTDAQKEFNDLSAVANKSIARERAELTRLLAVAKDETKSKEERTKAIDKLNQIVPQYNDQLSLETINTEEATKATNDYIAALLKKAKVQAAEEKLVEVQKELIDLFAQAGEKAGPSFWQTLGNTIYAAGGSIGFASAQMRTLAKNTGEEYGQLITLQDKLVEFINTNKEVADSQEEIVDTSQRATTGLNQQRVALEKLSSISSTFQSAVAPIINYNKALEGTGRVLQNSIATFSEGQAIAGQLNQALSEGLQMAAENIAVGMGQILAGFATGNAGLKDVGNLLAANLAQLLEMLGKTAIQAGIGMLAIKDAFTSLGGAGAIAAGVALVAFANIIKNSIRDIPNSVALASGGVVFGETLSLIGDNRNAAFDPEVVAPLSKLKDFIEPGGGAVAVEVGVDGIVRGQDLELIINRVVEKRLRRA